jgi:hypothetical protein
MVYVAFLGYAIRCYSDWPVEDKKFYLHGEQDKAIALLTSGTVPILGILPRTRKSIARERARIARARRKSQ